MESCNEFRKKFGTLVVLMMVVLLTTTLSFCFIACEEANGINPEDFLTKYTITVESGIENGSVTVDRTEAIEGITITITATPAENYELDSISVKDASGNAVTVTDGKFTMPNSNVVVSAAFKAKQYGGQEQPPAPTSFTVTIDADNGSAAATQTVEKDKKATKPADPVKDGYTFGGWYNGETAFNFDTAITANITITAKWTAVSYTITYSGITDATNLNTAATYTIESADIFLADATKNGFTFDGWFDAETGGNKVTKIAKGSKGNKVFYARWTAIPANSFIVTFVTDCDTTIAQKVVTDGNKVAQPTETLAKTGYTFGGWYNGETAFNFDTAITANIIITAKWTAVSYTITYNGITGATNPNTAATYTIESNDITLADATKDGFTFDGWFDAETGGNKVIKIAKGSTGNKVLYARWTEVTSNPGTGEGTGTGTGDTPVTTDSATIGVTVTVAANATIAVTKAVSADNATITLTASDGFTGYAWLIDGAAVSGVTGATISADGKTLTLTAANLKANAVYQITLSATKNSVVYGAQISVKK